MRNALTILQEATDTFQELKRMHQLNIELLENLSLACNHLVTFHIQVPNASTLASLLNKATTLLDEITASESQTIKYRKLSDDWKHRDKPNGKVTEPETRFCCISVCFISVSLFVF